MQHSCQIPTPNEYVEIMLNEAGYTTDLFGKRVLENSCGEGNILLEIVRRYISDCRRHGISSSQIRCGLMRDIVGYEVDLDCVNVCIDKLNSLLDAESILRVKWNIQNSDYLSSIDNEFDYVIGNPPYITCHNLSSDEREYLKKSFVSCRKGRFDYYYAFVEKSYYSLKHDGVLVYLVPFSFFRNKYAGTLRTMLRNDIISVLDYSGIQVFNSVTTSSAIITVHKGSNHGILQYTRMTSKKNVQVRKDMLQDKWFFATSRGKKRFGDYFSVQNSIATLCNDAFLITDYIDNGKYIETNGYRIEKSILRPAVSAKSCKNRDQQKVLVILPYKLNESGYVRYSENEFRKRFPGAFSYINSFAARLLKRKINAGVQWFEYGRTQALKEIQGKKLVIPMVITSKVNAYLVEENSVPYAGYFIKSKRKYPLTFAKQLLETPRFYEYVKEMGTSTTKSSYRISVEEIEDFTF